ncbi:MAG: MarR family winged helix-turn-helix transcriptional regulator [Bacillaceae bacterium]
MEQLSLSNKLLIVLMRAHHTVEEIIRKDIAKYGLNPTEFGVLEFIYHKGDQPIQQLGKKILLTSGSLTYVVDKLEKRGLLVRKQCPKDRRVTYASLTEEGHAFIEEIFPKHQEVIDDIFSMLTEEEKNVMIAYLKKIGLQTS